jgi:soluble lytic murein transglycosylase-like protein
MSVGPMLVLQGTLIGSFIVAILGFKVTSSVKAEELPQSPSTPSIVLDVEAAPTPIVIVIPNESVVSTDNQEDLFEASIAYTPDIEEAALEPPSNNDCRVSDRFPPNILQWCVLITRYAEKNSLSPDLIAALIVQESSGKPQAYSHSGAVGLMQVMPRDGIAAKFMCKNGPCFTNRPTIAELQDPEFNISYGTRMLAGLFKRFGNMRDALKSYGPMDVGYSYADKVLAIEKRYGQ